MFRLAENTVLTSIDTETLQACQSTGVQQYITKLKVKNSGLIKTCLSTDKLLAIMEDELISLDVKENQIFLITKDGEYHLPIMKERGVFIAPPPFVIPENLELLETWEYDFSGKSINSKADASTIALASTRVTLGPNLLARAVGPVLEYYGEANTAKVSLSIVDYKLIQKLGKVTLFLYQRGILRVEAEEAQLIFTTAKDPLSIQKMLEMFGQTSFPYSIDLSKVKIKALNKFSLKNFYLTLKNGEVVLNTQTGEARKIIPSPDLKIEEPLVLEVFQKDLPVILGNIKIGTFIQKGREFAVIQNIEGDKTTFFLTGVYKGENQW